MAKTLRFLNLSCMSVGTAWGRVNTLGKSNSGTYKNIICERVDSIETTLAHIIPEVLSSAFVPVALIVYMMTINWKLTLISLLCVPVGAAFFMLIMVGSQESYENTVVKTKKLNDTAVEHINGIEVIKAFGKP